MATTVEDFLETRTGGFVAGLGIGTLIFVTARFAPKLIIRAVLAKAPKALSGKIGSFIVEDASIGRVPLLQVGTKVNVGTVVGTIFTTSFYLFGGGHQLMEMGKSMLGWPMHGTGLPDEDSVSPVRFPTKVITTQSEFGRLVFVALNGARRDP